MKIKLNVIFILILILIITTIVIYFFLKEKNVPFYKISETTVDANYNEGEVEIINRKDKLLDVLGLKVDESYFDHGIIIITREHELLKVTRKTNGVFLKKETNYVELTLKKSKVEDTTFIYQVKEPKLFLDERFRNGNTKYKN